MVFLVSSTSHTFYILPPHTSPRTHFIFSQKLNRNQSLRTFRTSGGVRNHFSILMNSEHRQPSPERFIFMPNLHKAFPTTLHHLAQNLFFQLPYCSSTCNKIHTRKKKGNKKSLREDGVFQGVNPKTLIPGESNSQSPCCLFVTTSCHGSHCRVLTP